MLTLTAGPSRPELVGGSRDRVLALRREQQRVVADPCQQLGVRTEVVAEVQVHGHAAEDADAPCRPRRVRSRRARGSPTRSPARPGAVGRSARPRGGSCRRTRASNSSMPSMAAPAFTKSGVARRGAAARSSSSADGRTDSTPAHRLDHRVSTSGAPGKRPAIPTIAMPSASPCSIMNQALGSLIGARLCHCHTPRARSDAQRSVLERTTSAPQSRSGTSAPHDPVQVVTTRQRHRCTACHRRKRMQYRPDGWSGRRLWAHTAPAVRSTPSHT